MRRTLVPPVPWHSEWLHEAAQSNSGPASWLLPTTGSKKYAKNTNQSINYHMTSKFEKGIISAKQRKPWGKKATPDRLHCRFCSRVASWGTEWTRDRRSSARCGLFVWPFPAWPVKKWTQKTAADFSIYTMSWLFSSLFLASSLKMFQPYTSPIRVEKKRIFESTENFVERPMFSHQPLSPPPPIATGSRLVDFVLFPPPTFLPSFSSSFFSNSDLKSAKFSPILPFWSSKFTKQNLFEFYAKSPLNFT